jgi:hypothetical protein
MPSPYGHPQAGDVAAAPQKLSVRAASTADVADLTACSTTMDGVTLVEGDRVLLKSQTSGDENGVYLVGVVDSGTAPLTRAADMSSSSEVAPGMTVYVSEGTLNGNVAFVLTNNSPIVLDTTSLVFAKGPSVASGGGVSFVTPSGGATVTLTGDVTRVGAHALTLTTSNTTVATLPAGTETLVGRASTDTLTNKTLTTPTIGSFVNSAHDHSNAAGGGLVAAAGLAAGTKHQMLKTNNGATASAWGGLCLQEGSALVFVANAVSVSVAQGAHFDIPTTGAGSTITLLNAGAVRGDIMVFTADGVKNGHTVTFNTETGPTAISAAFTASKRLCCIAVYDGTNWSLAATVGP